MIFFDLDGTLIDSSRDIAAATNEALASLGMPSRALGEITAVVGRGPRHLFTQLLGEGTDRTLLDRLVVAFHKAYGDRLCHETIVYPGIEPMLEALSGREKVVLTNKSQPLADALIDKLGLRRHFSAVYGAEAFPTRKPDPQPILRVLKKYGVAAARATIVGDTIVDITAGKSAGITTVAVLYGFGSEESIRAAAPDHVVRTPEQVAEIFEETSR